MNSVVEVRISTLSSIEHEQPHIQEAKDAICLVLYDDKITQEKKTATGALCCIPLKNSNLCGLLTCYHVLPFTHDPATLTNVEIKNIEAANIKQHVILPHHSHISSIFTCKLLDVTFIAFDKALVRVLLEKGFHFHKKFAQENDIHYLYQYSNVANELRNIEGREIEEHGVNITHKMFIDNVNEGGVIINKQGEFYAFHNTKYNNVNYGTKFSCIIDAIIYYYTFVDNSASDGITIKLPIQMNVLGQENINALYNRFGLRPVIDTNSEENLIFKSDEYVKPMPHDTCRVWVCRTPYYWYYAEMSLKHKVEGLQWSNQDVDFVGKLKMFPWMPIWSNDNHIDVSGYANDMARILHSLWENRTNLI